MTIAVDLPVSRITFGTMRLDGAGDGDDVAHLLSLARDMGISSFHCSAEYDSYLSFVAAWARAGLAQRGTSLIAKLASPHFGEDRFSASDVRTKIERYLRDLNVDRLDVVQWLLRHDISQESARMRILLDSADEIARLVEDLKAEGKITALVGFPYTRPIAERLLTFSWCDGLALYVNPLERDMDTVVEACAHAGKPVVAIRPYAAGRVFAETELTAEQALDHVFGKAAVATAVASSSSERHLAMIASYLDAER